MKLSALYARKRPVYSFEFFPPKTDQGAKNLFKTVTELVREGPDYISVTCPLDKPRRGLTFDLVARIKREVGIEAMAHLVTVDYTRDEMAEVLERLRRDGRGTALIGRSMSGGTATCQARLAADDGNPARPTAALAWASDSGS